MPNSIIEPLLGYYMRWCASLVVRKTLLPLSHNQRVRSKIPRSPLIDVRMGIYS